MQRRGFEEAVELVVAKDATYDKNAYIFLRESLDFTVKNSSSRSGSDDRHVSGEELLFGFRDFALQEFGPMSQTVLEEWGVKESADVGSMVFNLVEVGAFGRTENDSPKDFLDVFDFNETFVKPFLPSSALNGETEVTPNAPESAGEEK